VSRAAERVFLSQSAMSNALKRLREMLEDPILVRGAKGMQPTPPSIWFGFSVCLLRSGGALR
ncbi:helix-turn-helix domain-containing protein, partial [Candidatus Nitrotoga fabula]